jgi:hypothetical protein
MAASKPCSELGQVAALGHEEPFKYDPSEQPCDALALYHLAQNEGGRRAEDDPRHRRPVSLAALCKSGEDAIAARPVHLEPPANLGRTDAIASPNCSFARDCFVANDANVSSIPPIIPYGGFPQYGWKDGISDGACATRRGA